MIRFHFGRGAPGSAGSWTPTGRDAAQAAYQVQVATSTAASEDLVWDSGRVPTSDSVHVEYAGEALTSATTCVWRVRVWSEGGGPVTWSQASTFETGLHEADDWA